jgi:uncharacterized membrane protein YdfJ with MMPL/SSD domain
VLDALAQTALERPLRLLGASLALLGIALLLAAGAPGGLGLESTELEEGRQADLVVVGDATVPAPSRVYRVALRAIEAQIGTDPAVQAVRRGVSTDRRRGAIEVDLAPASAAEREEAVERIEGAIDPGPLRIRLAGEVPTLTDARSALGDDLWRLELVALPLIFLALTAAVGLRLVAGPLIAGLTAVAGALAGLRIVDWVGDVSLWGIVPGSVVGLALGVELSLLIASRYRDEAASVSREEALGRAVGDGGKVALLMALGASLPGLALLATPLDQAPSLALGCALAAFVAAGSALLTMPALLVLTEIRSQRSALGAGHEGRAARFLRAPALALIASRRRALLGLLACVVALAALASAALDGESHPLGVADLPVEAEARQAAEAFAGRAVVPLGPTELDTANSLFDELPLAAIEALGLLALALLVATRSARLTPIALPTLLPAAAACGLAVLVFQDGELGHAVGLEAHGTLETGALASLLAALAAVAAARSAAALAALRYELDLGSPVVAAEHAASTVLPAAAVSTLVAGAAAGVLAASELAPAQEFGLAVAAGLVLDLILVRSPLLAALALLMGAEPSRQ